MYKYRQKICCLLSINLLELCFNLRREQNTWFCDGILAGILARRTLKPKKRYTYVVGRARLGETVTRRLSAIRISNGRTAGRPCTYTHFLLVLAANDFARLALSATTILSLWFGRPFGAIYRKNILSHWLPPEATESKMRLRRTNAALRLTQTGFWRTADPQAVLDRNSVLSL